MRLKVLLLCAACVGGGIGLAEARQGAPQPPTEFMVTNVIGNRVFLTWVPPATGPAPTAYRVSGGVSTNHVLGSVVVPAVPAFDLDLPPGFWHLRVHTIAGGQESVQSNEWTVRVGANTVPSSPGELIGLVNGQSLALTWRNRFQGGNPTSNQLDVSGTITASLPLPLSTTFTFDGVPPGTYNFRVRTANQFGLGPVSNTLTLTFPGACSGVPDAAEAFVSYAVGNTLFVRWRKPTRGVAPTAYRLSVSGAFTGVFVLPVPDISGAVGPGSYTLTVTTTNACGDGPTTPAQTVTIP